MAAEEGGDLTGFLARTTLLSEEQVKSMIDEGYVSVNDILVVDASPSLELCKDDVVAIAAPRSFYRSLPHTGEAVGADDEEIKVEMSFPHATYFSWATNSTNRVLLDDEVGAFVFPLVPTPLPEDEEDESVHHEQCAVCQYPVHDQEGLSEDEGRVTRLEVCGWNHFFHRACISQWLGMGKRQCPVCHAACGLIVGNMPEGTFQWYTQDSSVAGHPDVGTIVISYHFPNGTQTEEHYHPGNPYYGTSRTAFLPNNEEGQLVCKLLKIAFDRRLPFTVGDSITTGCTDQVVWAGIHHKTSTHGGAFGWPDETYVARVLAELADRGVTPACIETDDNEWPW